MGVGAKTVALPNANLRFEPDRDVLIAGMTRNQIKALPQVQTTNPKPDNKKTENNSYWGSKKG